MEKIKWGVLGTAGIARKCTIPGMLLAENCELTAIAGRSMEKAAAFQQEFGFERAYGSYEALLADPEIQAVYIPLPNHLHHEWAIKAVKAGKHVLCEKPLAPTPAEAEEMIAAAKENGVLLMEAFAYLHNPLMKAIKAELQSGAIGEPVYMESEFVTSDYDLSNIRMRKECCGGSVYDLGCYTTSQILWMLDMEPEKVQAIAEFSPEGVDVLTVGNMVFPGGVKASFRCGMCLATEKDQRIDCMIIHGQKGFIRTDAEFNQAGTLSYTVATEDGTVVKTVEVPQNYSLEVTQLGKCISEGETPYVSNDFTLRNSRTIEKVLQAIGY